MQAEIIASGTELLLGEIADTNTSYIANQLAILGIDLYYASIVGDNYERFLGILKQAYQRSDIVIITGGLGPTKGDITREVIAGFMQEKIEIDPALKSHITEHFTHLGFEMPENNLRQAMIIPSAISIHNPLGTAPGWWVEKNNKIIVSLPGPPGEMQPMWRAEIVPRLERKGKAVIVSRTLKTWGLSEARIDQMVGPYMSSPNPTLALYAKPDGIHLRITAKAANRQDAEEIIQIRETDLREILREHVWGTDNETLEMVISRLMLHKGLSVAAVESFTGGALSCALSATPESHKFFKGAIIASDNQTRYSLGIVPQSTDNKVDIYSAIRMAALAREKFAADIGIGLDGYLEPDREKLTGEAFIAIDFKQGKKNFSQAYPWRHNLLARRSVMHTLFSLRNILLSPG